MKRNNQKELKIYHCKDCTDVVLCTGGLEVCLDFHVMKPPKHFDTDGYIKKRNKFISDAADYADEQVGKKCAPGGAREEWNDKWSAVYHRQMEQLWRASL